MKFIHGIAAILLFLFAAAPLDASAQDDALLQRYRSRRQKVTGGVMNIRSQKNEMSDSLAMAEEAAAAARADSLRLAADSLLRSTESQLLRADSLWAAQDSMTRNPFVRDSLTAVRDSLFAVSSAARAADSLATVRADSLAAADLELFPAPQAAESPDTVVKRSFREMIFPDSSSLSRVCWTATVLPGYGQIYNKQYWKLPILYGLVGTSLGMFIHENKRYSPLNKEFDALTDGGLSRTPEMDALQARLIRSNTRRELYLGAMLASYIYFIGDAAVNYSTNDVSRIKKATTLSTICPGAGQIYNRSYWKVPFVIGGFASMVYCIDWNNRGYKRFQKAYSLLADYEANPDNYPDGPTDEFKGRYSSSFIKNLKDSYRRNRDLCIILTGAVYILQIIDAHVDAHLKDYDISDDLSLNIEPMIKYNYVPAQGNRMMYGFNLSLNF